MDQRIKRLFIRLAAIYGHLWNNLYQHEEFTQLSQQEWQNGLKSFDNATLGRALERCCVSMNYPPTLPMFIEICRALKPTWTQSTKRDVLPKCNPLIAEHHLAKIRSILGKSRSGDHCE